MHRRYGFGLGLGFEETLELELDLDSIIQNGFGHGVGFKGTLDLGTDISINSHQWEFLWESIATLGISWRIKSQIWD